jgi:hypothetical protein
MSVVGCRGTIAGAMRCAASQIFLGARKSGQLNQQERQY